MRGVLLTLAPILLVLCLSGYGRALEVLSSGKALEKTSSIFDSAFYGLFLVTAGALAANFIAGLGDNPAPIALASGLALFLVFQWRDRFEWKQLLLLILLLPVVCFLSGKISFGHDTGLYHIPAMNWVAYQPLPLGLANLHSRFGFDSAFLIFQSAFRSEPLLGWSHLSIIEVAVRCLVVAWITNRLLTKLATDGWCATSALYAAVLAVVLRFLWEFGQTSTDTSANLLAICAWVSFCNLILMDENELQSNGGSELLLLLVLTTLAITFKLSMLPSTLLVVLIFIIRGWRELCAIVARQSAILLLLGSYLILWLARNFMLSGCAIYPLQVTCTPVRWGVGPANAAHMQAVIRGWARHPGPGMFEFARTFNFAWFPSWFAKFKSSFEFKTTLAAGVFFLFSLLATRHKKSDRSSDVRRLIWTSITFATIGLTFWFLTAPAPRFSWAYFVILSSALIFAGLHSLDDRVLKVGIAPIALGALVLSVVAVLKLPSTRPALIEPPKPPSKMVVVSGWRFYEPTSTNQCWALFPCTPAAMPSFYRVERRGDRLAFVRKGEEFAR